jgi:N-acetylneuraminic acid mutarotase
MGGYYQENTFATAELFNPKTLRFTALKSRMALSRSEFEATALTNGKVLITGGGSGASLYKTAELFNPRTKRFTALPSKMTARREGHASSRLVDDSILVTGGGNANSDPLVVFRTAELFNPKTLKFRAIPNTMTTERFFHTQTTLNDGSVLLTGGLNVTSDGSFRILNTAEKYSP